MAAATGKSALMRESKRSDVYAVTCPECGWFGMSDECRYGKCPNCNERVVKDK